MSEDEAAEESEQTRHDDRDEQRTLQRLADGKAFPGNAAADQPLTSGKTMNHQRRLARRGLSTQADNRVLVTLLAVDRCGTFKVSRDLGSVRRQQCNRRLRVRI